MDNKPTCKYLEETCGKKEKEKKTLTASHWMLYIVLGIYIIVSIMCIIFMGVCLVSDKYEGVAQTLIIPTVSLVGTCSCTVVGFYSTKATKENEIKLSNDKYRMRLEIAKEIFAEYGTSLDEKSVDLLRKLMSDENVSEISSASSPPTTTISMPCVDKTTNIITEYSNIKDNDSEEGLG